MEIIGSKPIEFIYIYNKARWKYLYVYNFTFWIYAICPKESNQPNNFIRYKK